MSNATTITIKHHLTGAVLFEHSAFGNTIRKTIEAAIKSGANLCDADLYCADLRDADLYCADLRGADLRGVNLCGANLCDADLRGVNLCGVNLCGADLRGTDLRGVNLRGVNLCGVNLCGVNLCGVNLCDAKGVYIACPTEGSFIGWKKAGGFIVKLLIPEDARRCSATGEKCRCDKAAVLEIQNADGTKAEVEAVHSDHDRSFVYTVGGIVEVPDFDNDRWRECSRGIHFFVDRRAAVEY